MILRTRAQGFATAALLLCDSSGQGQFHTLDLGKIPAAEGWKGATSAFSTGKLDGQTSVECNAPGQHVTWLEGAELDQGTLEFDAKGRSEPQSSFIGVAFRVHDASTFDAVYFRPFNFRPEASERRSRAIQYISEPAWPWEKLRAKKTGQYESAAVPAPDGDAWFHAKVTIEGRQVKVWVDGAAQPSLVADELSDRQGGAIGVICIGRGAIANLKVVPRVDAVE